MKSVELRIGKILKDSIDAQATVGPFEDDAELSPFLKGAFELYVARAANTSLVVAKPSDFKGDIGAVQKRSAALQQALGQAVALLLDSVPPAGRRLLIAARQSFMCDDGSLYLPELAVAFQAFEPQPLELPRMFKPSQQAVFLCCLYWEGEFMEQARIKERLGLSLGGVSEALASFVDLGMLDYSIAGKTGRQRLYFIEDKARFYEVGRRYFGSAVKNTMLVSMPSKNPHWLLSGLSALSERSQLLPPRQPCFATSPAEAKQMGRMGFDAVEYCTLQVLHYDPRPFATGGVVDPFTMLATLGESDERVSMAVREAMRGYGWFKE